MIYLSLTRLHVSMMDDTKKNLLSHACHQLKHVHTGKNICSSCIFCRNRFVTGNVRKMKVIWLFHLVCFKSHLPQQIHIHPIFLYPFSSILSIRNGIYFLFSNRYNTLFFYFYIDEKSVEFFLDFNKPQVRYAQVIGHETILGMHEK